MIYFIQSKSDNRIKIGRSDDPVRRLRQLKTGSSTPEPYVILAVLPGGAKQEKRIKRKFKNCHSHGEWFNPLPELLRFIEEHTKVDGLLTRCRVCGKLHLSEPDEGDIKAHAKTHKDIRQGAYPYDVREFMKQVAWTMLESDDPTVEITLPRDRSLLKRLIVYAWWARAREQGVRDIDFDDYVLDYIDYFDIRESGDEKKRQEIKERIDKHWNGS